MNSHQKQCVILTALTLLTGFLLFCGKGQEKPMTLDPAYKTELIFKDTFSGDLKNWFVAGKGIAEITPDSALFLKLGPESTNLLFWSVRDFSDSFQLEYKITFPDSSGSHIVFLCAQGNKGENVTQMPPPPPEAFEQYIENSITSYQISCHTYTLDDTHQSNSRVRKNPGNLLLANVPSDPCKDNRDYIIDVLKIGNRIQFYVDGTLIHDLRDRGGFGPTYMTGKIGFYIQGRAGVFSAILDDIRVFKLTPK